MKFYIVSIAVLALVGVIVGADKAQIKQFAKECMEQNKVTEQEFKDLHSGKMNPVPDHVKCSMKCFLDKNGFNDASGAFKPDAVLAALDDSSKKAELEQALEKCKGLKSTNPCEQAYMITSCMFENKVKMNQ